jgi:hypothetical protein
MSDLSFTREKLRREAVIERLVKELDTSLMERLIPILTKPEEPLEVPFMICKRIYLPNGTIQDTEITIKKKVQILKPIYGEFKHEDIS